MRKRIVGGQDQMPGLDVLGPIEEAVSQTRRGVLLPCDWQAFVEHRNPFEKPTDQLAGWQTFYREVFGFETDFSGLAIPAKRKGFERLVVVAQGITPQRAYAACAKLFPCWKWMEEGLDEVIDFSFQTRSAKDDPYAIWARDRVEADEELKNLSADVLTEKGIPGITLEERLLYEAKYFKETGKHLDLRYITLCAGSRLRCGFVPKVYWRGHCGGLDVGRDYPGFSRDRLRSREAVS